MQMDPRIPNETLFILGELLGSPESRATLDSRDGVCVVLGSELQRRTDVEDIQTWVSEWVCSMFDGELEPIAKTNDNHNWQGEQLEARKILIRAMYRQVLNYMLGVSVRRNHAKTR